MEAYDGVEDVKHGREKAEQGEYVGVEDVRSSFEEDDDRVKT